MAAMLAKSVQGSKIMRKPKSRAVRTCSILVGQPKTPQSYKKKRISPNRGRNSM